MRAFKKLKQLITRAVKRGHMLPQSTAAYTWPGYTSPERLYLTLEETERIAKLVYNGTFDTDINMLKISCFFLVECYSGIRFCDWSTARVETLIAERSLKVRAKKNGEPVYLPLNTIKRLGAVLDFIESRKLVFDIPEQITNRLLKYLATEAKIPKHLTTHVGRHTCATLLVGLGYSEYDIAEVLGISVGTVKTYSKMTRKRLETAFRTIGGL